MIDDLRQRDVLVFGLDQREDEGLMRLELEVLRLTLSIRLVCPFSLTVAISGPFNRPQSHVDGQRPAPTSYLRLHLQLIREYKFLMVAPLAQPPFPSGTGNQASTSRANRLLRAQ